MTVSEGRWPLAVLPTPLVRAPRLGATLGLDLWVKRDDLTGFGLAGNKARAIEVLIADAVATGCDHVVGCGGGSSNFCAGLAMGAATAGLRCTLVLYGSEPRPPHPNLAIALAAGASIIYTESPDRETVEPRAVDVAADLTAGGERAYVVPRGGATARGAAGFVRAADELLTQLAAHPAVAGRGGRVVIAAGSGASAAGLMAGLAAAGADLAVMAGAVSRPADETRDRIILLAEECASLLGHRPPDVARLDVVDCIGPGFGVPDPEAGPVVELARRTEGLFLDATYTAKAAALLPRLAPDTDRPTVFWHTGGWVGAMTELTRTVAARGPVHVG
jgi:D-cysteine desulfhydrase